MSATQTKSDLTFADITRTPIAFAGARLVGYKESPSQSAETIAFSADVYIHDTKVGVLRNDGSGGEDMFHPVSREGYAAFLAAEESFPGIADAETGGVYDLINTLVEVASLAKRFSGRKVSFIPDVDPEVIIRTWKFSRYELPSKYAKALSATLPYLMNRKGAESMLYPVREKGYWFHYATR